MARVAGALHLLLALFLAWTALGANYSPFVRSGATWTYLGADWDQVLIAGGRTDVSCPSPSNGCTQTNSPFYRLDLATGQFTAENINVTPATLSDAVRNGWLYCHAAGLNPQDGIDSIYFTTVLGVARLARISTAKAFGDLVLTSFQNSTPVTRNGQPVAPVSLCSNLRFEARHIHESHFWLNGGFVGTGVNIAIQPFYAWLSPLTRTSNMWHLITSNPNQNILPSAAAPVSEGDPMGYSTAASVKTPDSDYNFNVYYFWNGTNQALHLYTPQLPGTFTYDWRNASAIMSAVPPREFQSMTQDADGSRIFIYGGRNPVTGATLNDLWVIWTYGTSNFTTWKVVQVPIGVTAVEPTARFAASMMFDDKRSLLYIWGGETAAKGDNRIYILSPPQTPQLERVTWLEGLPVTSSNTTGNSTTTDPTTRSADGGTNNLGAIIGGAVGGAVVLAGLAGLGVFLVLRKRRDRDDKVELMSNKDMGVKPSFSGPVGAELRSTPPTSPMLTSPVSPSGNSRTDIPLRDDKSVGGRTSLGSGSGAHTPMVAPKSPIYLAEEIDRVTESGSVERITVLRPFSATSPQPPSIVPSVAGGGSHHSQHDQSFRAGLPATMSMTPSISAVAPLRTTSVTLAQLGSTRSVNHFDYQGGVPGHPMHFQVAPGKMYTATDNYLPQLQDEIAVTKGDILVVLQTYDDGWAKVANRTTDASGFVPSYILG